MRPAPDNDAGGRIGIWSARCANQRFSQVLRRIAKLPGGWFGDVEKTSEEKWEFSESPSDTEVFLYCPTSRSLPRPER